jgi:hypothetical protein
MRYPKVESALAIFDGHLIAETCIGTSLFRVSEAQHLRVMRARNGENKMKHTLAAASLALIFGLAGRGDRKRGAHDDTDTHHENSRHRNDQSWR